MYRIFIFSNLLLSSQLTTTHHSHPATKNLLPRYHSVTMSIDFSHVSYKINFLLWIRSSSSNSSTIANDHRLEGEFRIATHAIQCNHISERAVESFHYIDYVYDFYQFQTASPPQVNPTPEHVANPPPNKVAHHQSITPHPKPPQPHSPPTEQIPPQRVVRPDKDEEAVRQQMLSDGVPFDREGYEEAPW